MLPGEINVEVLQAQIAELRRMIEVTFEACQ